MAPLRFSLLYLSLKKKPGPLRDESVSDATNLAWPLPPVGFMMALTNKSSLCLQPFQQMRHVDSDMNGVRTTPPEMTELECHTVHKPCAVNGEHLLIVLAGEYICIPLVMHM